MLPPPVPAVSASPAPSATPRVLKTIVTVSSSPYCTALVQHFNGALLPILANDRTIEVTGGTLDDLDTLWDRNDYVSEYFRVRDRLGREAQLLDGSLDEIQREIDALRQAEKLTTNPQAAQQIRDAAHQLQEAYNKQQTLAIQLTGIHDNMLRYNVISAPAPEQGFNMALALAPQDQKNVKLYVQYVRVRGAIDYAEDKAIDIAADIAENRCGAK